MLAANGVPVASEIVIAPFDGGREMATRIALEHLAVRFGQRESGENQFRANIYEALYDLTRIPGYYVEPGGNFFVARTAIGACGGGELAGFVGLKKTGEGEGALKRLATLPQHRRQGIGRLLVGTALDWAREHDFQTIHLATGKGEKARPIYEKFGFREVGSDDEHNDWLMELDLAK